MGLDWEWQPAWIDCLGDCQLALLEIYSPIRIGLGPYSFIRGSLINHLTDPLLARNEQLRKPLHSWWYQGLLGGNDQTRAEMGALLADAVDDDFPNRDVAREVFRDARSYQRTEAELVDAIEAVQRLLGRPIAVMIPIHQFLPDGRQLPWPPGFADQAIAAARLLELPVFQPADIVKDYGIADAWKGANGPYQEAFWPVLGDVLLRFMRKALDGGAIDQRRPERIQA
jgi:hypothetical protein